MRPLSESSAAHLQAHKGIQRVPSPALELFVVRNFLDAGECTGLIERIEANCRPSTIADANGDDYFRTSDTCDLECSDPVVVALDAKFAALSGINPAPREPIQGQRYKEGQEFKPHTDYFEPEAPISNGIAATG